MGYTHYWERPQIIQPNIFQAIGNDLLKLLPELETLDVPLANAHGHEEPEIGPEFIGFNGVEFCGHARNENVRLTFPKDDACGIGHNDGIGSSLPYRTCNGNCSYESVWFQRVARSNTTEGTRESFCKTAFRPYDLAVTAFLVIAKHHLKTEITVYTDGNHQHWCEAFGLCQTELGYGSEFCIEKIGKTKFLRLARE